MKNAFRIVFIFIIISLSSIFCIPRLNINMGATRLEDTNQLTISYTVSGSNPEQTEQNATSVIENVVSQVKGLKKLNSVSGYGYGRIQLIFDNFSSISEKRFEIQSLIRQVKPFLHTSVSYPIISGNSIGYNSTESPLLIYTLSASAPNTDIKHSAEDIIPKKLNNIEGIKDIDISGSSIEEISVSFNSGRLSQLKLTPDDIYRAIGQYNKISHIGSVKDSNAQVTFFIKSYTKNIDNLRSLQNVEIKK